MPSSNTMYHIPLLPYAWHAYFPILQTPVFWILTHAHNHEIHIFNVTFCSWMHFPMCIWFKYSEPLESVASYVYLEEGVHYASWEKGIIVCAGSRAEQSFSLECLESVNGGQFLRMASADLMSSTMCVYEWTLLCVGILYAPSHPPRLVSSGSLQSAAILCFVYVWILNLCGPRPLPHCVLFWSSMNSPQCHLLQATDTNSRFKKQNKTKKRS